MQTQQSKTDTNLNFQESERELQNHFKRIKENDRRVNFCVCVCEYICNGVEWSKDRTGSGVNKVETTAGVWQQSGFTCSAADNFQHTQNPHAHA